MSDRVKEQVDEIRWYLHHYREHLSGSVRTTVKKHLKGLDELERLAQIGYATELREAQQKARAEIVGMRE